MKRITVALPEHLAELVKSEARHRQTSVSDIIRQLIIHGLTGSSDKPRTIPWAELFNDPEMIPSERLDEALSPWSDDLDRQ